MIKKCIQIVVSLFLLGGASKAALPLDLQFLNDYEIYINGPLPGGRGILRVNLENNRIDKVQLKFCDGTDLRGSYIANYRILTDGFVFYPSCTMEYEKYEGYTYLDNSGKCRDFIPDFNPVGVTGTDEYFTFSYDGQKILVDGSVKGGKSTSNLYAVNLKTKVAWLICEDPGWGYGRLILRNNRTVVYQNRKNEIWKWDYETQQSEFLTTLNVTVNFGDVSQDDSQILCRDPFNIYIFNLKKKEIRLVKHYSKEDWMATDFSDKPKIVGKELAWLDGRNGFIFAKHTPGFMKWVTAFFNKNNFNPDLYYYDLDTNQECRIMSDAHVYQLYCRKKAK